MKWESKYEEQVRPRFYEIAKWTEAGWSVVQIAKELGVSASTLNKYKEKHPELQELWESAKHGADEVVEGALFTSCQDRYMVEVTKETRVMTDGSTVEVTRERRVPVPGSVPAQQFWLANRKNSAWKFQSQFEKVRDEGTDDSTGVVLIPEVVEDKPHA